MTERGQKKKQNKYGAILAPYRVKRVLKNTVLVFMLGVGSGAEVRWSTWSQESTFLVALAFVSYLLGKKQEASLLLAF